MSNIALLATPGDPIVETQVIANGAIQLNHIPEVGAPVLIPGLTQVSAPIGQDQFAVDYATGIVSFLNTTGSVTVSYTAGDDLANSAKMNEIIAALNAFNEAQGDAVHGACQTTDDATPQDLLIVPAPLNTISIVSFFLKGVRVSGGVPLDYQFAKFALIAKNIGGVITFQQIQFDYQDNTFAAWSRATIVRGNNGVLTVTGTAGEVINWTVDGFVRVIPIV